MLKEFGFEAETSRNPATLPRPQIQRQARLLTKLAPNPFNREQEGGLAYPYPGKGVSGETTN